VRRGLPSELAAWAAQDSPKGEMVILIGPPVAGAVTDETIAAKLEPLLGQMSLSEAARVIADLLGVPKARAYDVGLALKKAAGE
jgi:16S rRNA (cytidine1402-2'-O)-methyltransferase